MDPQSRLVAGRYRLLSPVGAGGMGTVWRGRDELLGREVAVKEVLFPPALPEEDREVLRERTRREARAAAKLDHPSAVTVYDVVEEDGAPYLVMELVEARTLSQVVRDEGPLSPARTARVGLALLGALEAAHARGIVHRDVKPGNVLLGHGTGADERVVLTDFGIASTAGDTSITSTGLLLGSPSYIAPERARGRPPAPASDLWSLGATLFTAVEGVPPFDGGEPLLTVTAVVTGEHAPFVRSGPLEDVLEGLLEREPARRLSAAAARRALQAVAATEVARAGAPAAASTRTATALPRTERTTALPVAELRLAELAAADSGAGARTAAAARATATTTAVTTSTRTSTRTAARPAPRPAVRFPDHAADRPPAAWDSPRERARSRARTPLVLLALVLAVVLGGTGLVLALDAGPAQRVAPSAMPSPSAEPEPEPSAEPTAGPEGAEPAPPGWRTVEGAAGWRTAVPPSYATSTFNGAPQYKDGDTGRTLRVSATAPGGGRTDLVQDRRAAAAAFAGRHRDYVELGISPVAYRDWPAADWEFTYTDGGSSLHAISRVVLVDGRGYSLFFQTRGSDDWDDARADFEQIAASFEPA